MADAEKNSMQLLTDHQKFVKYLQERFNVPTEEWWSTANDKFYELCKILAQKDSTFSAEEKENEFSPRTARSNALPSTVILSSGAYSMRLTTTDEPLECSIFGTTSPSLYLEVFWEHVGKAQRALETNLVVHEIDQGSVLRILLTFGELLFELKYMHCESLIRKYPTILNAPWSFLHDATNCSTSIEKSVQGLQRDARLHKYLEGSSSRRYAYQFIRAWARVSGVSGKWGLTPPEIVKLYHDDEEEDLSVLIETFFQNADEEYSDLFTSQCKTLGASLNADFDRDTELRIDPLQFLSQLYDLPPNQHMNFPYYLRVQVISTGSSKAKTGQWLSRYLERKLLQLRDRLKPLLPRSVEARYWPRRLVGQSSSTTNSFYEGVYILGVQISDAEKLKSAVEEAFAVWEREIGDYPLSIDAQGRVFASVVSNADLEKENLRPCTQTWPRPIVTDDKASSKGLPKELDERPKRAKGTCNAPAENLSNNPKSRLRPASDVLNRLRHDINYDIDEFVVGYRDRHSARLMEKPARSWARDTTDEEWIPEHRIEYFKRYVGGSAKKEGEIVWNREKKVDKLFTKG